MKLAFWHEDEWHFFSNEDIGVGDEVFPVVDCYTHNGVEYVTGINKLEDHHMHGFPDEPHTIKRIEEGRVYTDRGYSPSIAYFKYLGTDKKE